MAHATLLTDDLLRHLMAVGQVDVVVGLPTLNNVGTIADTLDRVQAGLSEHFPRARTVVISADGGSADGTPDILADLSSPSGGHRAGGLRTRHQIGTSYGGVPGKAGAVRLIFTAADLLQARAIAVLDPDVTSLTPAWIDTLVGPVWKQRFDFVAPVYGRHPREGLLVTQLIRPLMRATYGRQVEEPLVGEFGCSGRFAAQCVAQDVWDGGPIRDGIELWLTGTALTGTFQACQAFLGPRTLAPPHGPRSGLGDVLPLLVGSLFACLDRHATAWLSRNGAEPLPVVGPEPRRVADAAAVDGSRLRGTLSEDVRDLRPILESLLAPDTFAALSSLAESGDSDVVGYPDDLWVATVYDFLAAHHAGVMDRAHIAQALMPLYRGRAASFLAQHAASSPDDVALDLERLSQQFERAKPCLIERWNRAT